MGGCLASWRPKGGKSAIAPPAAPTGLAATPGAGSSVFTWTLVSGASSYNLYRSIHGANSYSAIQTGLLTASATDATGAIGVSYDYYVTSLISSVESSPSNIVAVTVVIYDTMTDTNGTALSSHVIAPINTPSTSWSIVGLGGAAPTTWTIQSNVAKGGSGGGSNIAAVAESGLVNLSARLKINMLSVTTDGGFIFRYTDSNNFWFAQIDKGASRININEVVSGVFHEGLASAAFTVNANTDYTLYLAVLGTTVVLAVDGGPTITYTTMSSSLAATKIGLFRGGENGANNLITWDDFEVLSYPYFLTNLQDTYLLTVGDSPLVLTPVVATTFGGSQTYAVVSDSQGNDKALVKSGANTFTYAPIFEDGGTFRTATFRVTDGTRTATKSISITTLPNWSAKVFDAGNPILASQGAYDAGSQDSPFVSNADIVNGTMYALSVVRTAANANTDFNDICQYTSTSPYRGPFVGVVGNPKFQSVPATWEHKAINHISATIGPLTGGVLSGKYIKYYSAQDPGGIEGIGILYSTDLINWTRYASNPVLTGMSICCPCIFRGLIYLFVTSPLGSFHGAGRIDLYISPLTDGTAFTLLTAGIIPNATTDWDYMSGSIPGVTARLDPWPHVNSSGALELMYTVYCQGNPTIDGQVVTVQACGYIITNDGVNWYKYQHIILINDALSAWFTTVVGDPVLMRFENYIYLYFAGGTDPGDRNVSGGLAYLHSGTTGHFVGIATTTFADGNTVYSTSPNGYTAANMTAVPASGSCAVTVTGYSASDVLLSVAATNGASVTFTLNGMTNSHAYNVKKNGVTIATPTANGGGTLVFSNSVWGTSDTLEIIA